MTLLSKSKKIILFIVEGISDKIALGSILRAMYKSDFVDVQITDGDLTTKNGVRSSNVISKLKGIVTEYMSKHRYKPSDFKAFVHIVDTDGAYIPERCILNRCIVGDGPKYNLDGIYTSNVNAVIGRNIQKTGCLDVLTKLKELNGKPYFILYFSCNLDHVLYNEMNLVKEDKIKFADEFNNKYINNIEAFKKFMLDSSINSGDDYETSWKFIKEDMNSINRYTNFGLLFNNIV